jgi:hemolysin activation/secretion protein
MLCSDESVFQFDWSVVWRRIGFIVLLLPACFALDPANGQQNESSATAGTLLREYERLEELEKPAMPDLQKRPERPPLQAGEGATVSIREIVFSGATELVSRRELNQLVSEAIGMELDFAGLEQLTARVTDYLKAQGWFLARAYLPQQEISNGVLEVVILAGELSDQEPVDVVPGGGDFDRVMPSYIERMVLAALPSGEPVREDNVSRAVLLTSDLPGMRTQSRLRPGPEVGTSTLELIVNEEPLLSAQTRIDNYGSDSTGSERATATAQLNNPSGAGDRITLGSTQNEGSELYRASWQLPIGSSGLTLDFGVTNLHYEVITAEGKELGIEGRTRTNTQSLSYPVIRSATRNLTLSVTGRQQHMIDRAESEETSNKRKNSVTVGINHASLDTFAGGGQSTWSAELVAGQLDLKANAAAFSQDQQTYQTHGAYQKVVLSGTRTQKLTERTTLFGRASAQYANENLDSSEQLSLGGLAGVRGYPGGEAGGDSAAILQMELRHDWPLALPANTRLSSQAFIDSGWVRLREAPGELLFDTATERNQYTLHSVGVGFTLASPGSFRVNALWAHALGDNPGRSTDGTESDGSSHGQQLYLQASARF